MRQCCYFVIAFIAVSVMLMLLVGPCLLILDMRSLMAQMRRQLKKEQENLKQLEEIRLKENQLHAEGMRFLQQCIGQEVGERNSFTGVRLFWGLIEIGYTNKQQYKSCISEYNKRFSQKLVLN